MHLCGGGPARMKRMPDRQPASAAPGTRATRPQSLTVAIVVAYGVQLATSATRERRSESEVPSSRIRSSSWRSLVAPMASLSTRGAGASEPLQGGRHLGGGRSSCSRHGHGSRGLCCRALVLGGAEVTLELQGPLVGSMATRAPVAALPRRSLVAARHPGRRDSRPPACSSARSGFPCPVRRRFPVRARRRK